VQLDEVARTGERPVESAERAAEDRLRLRNEIATRARQVGTQGGQTESEDESTNAAGLKKAHVRIP
jgi:hypothetical protein